MGRWRLHERARRKSRAVRLRSDPAPGANGLSAAARPKAARGRGGEQGHGASHVTAGLTTKYKYLKYRPLGRRRWTLRRPGLQRLHTNFLSRYQDFTRWIWRPPAPLLENPWGRSAST